MSEYPYGAVPPRRSQRPRRRQLVRAALALVLLGAVFVAGIALGEALNDGPNTGKIVTYVRTLEPLPQRAP